MLRIPKPLKGLVTFLKHSTSRSQAFGRGMYKAAYNGHQVGMSDSVLRLGPLGEEASSLLVHA